MGDGEENDFCGIILMVVCMKAGHWGQRFSHFGSPTLLTGANANILNTTIQLDKNRSKNRVQGLKSQSSSLKCLHFPNCPCIDHPFTDMFWSYPAHFQFLLYVFSSSFSYRLP